MSKLARLPRRRGSFRPRIEALEDRALMATFTVDDSFVADNPAQRKYDTIQEAVNAASAGDTIKVLAGSYEENVLVDKRLTIQGASAKLSQAFDPNKASILDPVDNGAAGSPASGFSLQANDIVIKGFTIAELDGTADVDGTVGVNTSASFSGYRIRDNVIESNSIGIYLNTATTAGARPTIVSDNVIRDNNDGFGVAAAAGNGIYSDQGARNVQITKNVFGGHKNEDIIFVAPTALQTNITIRNNVLKDSSGIFFINVSNSKIEGNAIQRSFANAIELAGGNENITVKHNALRDVGTDGYNGIFLHNGSGAGANTDNLIMNNAIINAGLSGIVIRDSSDNTVRGNLVVGSKGFDLSNLTWGNGISLEGATDNQIEHNILRDNARDGIRVDAASVDNFFKQNRSTLNDEHDYHDDSTGSGTAGTGNTWRHNRGRTDSPDGLIWKQA